MINYHKSLTDKTNLEGWFQVVRVNFDDFKIISKLENIGIYPGEIIYLIKKINNSSVMLIKINDVIYGIRTKDANNIIVKKVVK